MLPSVKIAISASSTVLRGSRRGGDGEQRRADGDAERVARDQQAGGGDGDMEIRRHLQQQAHDDEFGGADSEGTGGEGEESDWHDGRTVHGAPNALRLRDRVAMRCELDLRWAHFL